MKVLFLFNQLLSKKLSSGGDVKAKKVMDLWIIKGKDTITTISPDCTDELFKHTKAIKLKTYNFETFIKSRKHTFTIFISYIVRTIQGIRIVKSNEYSMLYSTGDFICNILPSYFYKTKYPKSLWCTCIFHINTNPITRKSNYLFRNIISYILQRISFFFIKQKADIIFVLNNEVKQYLLNRGFEQIIIKSGAGLDLNQIRAINKYKPPSRIEGHKFNEKGKNIVFFARVNPTKGIYDLPKILSRILEGNNNVKLNIVGGYESKTKEELEKQFREYDCHNNVTFYGFVEKKLDVYYIIKNSLLSVFPSYEEGWGITLCEAALLQTPIIAYDLPVYKEIFDNKLDTVEVGNTKSLSDLAISKLKNRDMNKVIDLYNHVKQYTWENVYKTEMDEIQNHLKAKSNYE